MNRSIVLLVGAAFASASCTTGGSEHDEPQTASVTVPEKKRYDEPPQAVGHDSAAPARPRGKQIPPPEDVAAAPADAERTASGIAYEVLKEGEGDAHPGAEDTVEVKYTGWTTDGVTFDTTEGKGPRSFPVGRVIAGWTEGIQLMTRGAEYRFWIPEALAYKGRPGAPQGMLVFDIELLDIVHPPRTPANVAAPPAGAKRTKSGIAYEVLEKGSGGEHPRPWDQVTVHYSGWTTDGKMFDSSVTKGKPLTFPLGRVIEGWKQGIPLMVVGEKTRFWIPKELAYDGKPGRPQGMLVFDIELIDLEKLPEPPPAPETPANVEAPPADATRTESGLAYEVLEEGKGGEHPTPRSRVTVHYSGWTTDGKMFDSSIVKGKPATFPVARVIPGWTEGLQLMTKGDKMRFWIPVELAYDNRPGKPPGMLVFDVELIDFK